MGILLPGKYFPIFDFDASDTKGNRSRPTSEKFMRVFPFAAAYVHYLFFSRISFFQEINETIFDFSARKPLNDETSNRRHFFFLDCKIYGVPSYMLCVLSTCINSTEPPCVFSFSTSKILRPNLLRIFCRPHG